jgi:5-methylcytosine-specific restriction protein B
MRKGLDKEALRRIWQYNIEPFVEDQFFGDQSQVEYFRFEAVHRRYLASANVDELGRPVLAGDESELSALGVDEE